MLIQPCSGSKRKFVCHGADVWFRLCRSASRRRGGRARWGREQSNTSRPLILCRDFESSHLLRLLAAYPSLRLLLPQDYEGSPVLIEDHRHGAGGVCVVCSRWLPTHPKKSAAGGFRHPHFLLPTLPLADKRTVPSATA